MDIVADQAAGTNTAFLSLAASGTANNLYTVDLNTGMPVLRGAIGGGANITELAVQVAGAGLPVTLAELTIKKQGRTAMLSWTTETEINNDHFIIERQIANGSFMNVSGNIRSKAVNGNSSQRLHYSFTDASPANGINYYRLVQVDKDAQIKHSKVLAVSFDGRYEITLYPNPVKDVLHINGYLPASGLLTYRLLNAQGVTLRTQNKNATGNWNSELNTNGLAAGMYYLQVVHNGNIIYSAPVHKQ
jgi:hypothetical protein